MIDATFDGFPGRFCFLDSIPQTSSRTLRDLMIFQLYFLGKKRLASSVIIESYKIDCLKKNNAHEEKWQVTSLEYREIISLGKKKGLKRKKEI